MRSLTALVVFIFISLSSFAQKGKIEGKITDVKTGNPISGISVVVKETGKGIATDISGHFILSVEPGKKYTLIISSTGYEGKEVTDVEMGADGIAHIDIALNSKTKTGEEVVIRSTSARKETTNALISFQKNTNTVASVISAEAIRRSPDKNTGEVLKRTPGASLQDGKFIVVRGLADRYNQAMINGILLTSTEPDRKTFSFDLIPASMIDNIVINKAFVPELPGEWAGGLIQVNTKDIPSKNFLNIQIGTGINSQTIGKKFYEEKGGKTDWLGIDDGTRNLPSSYTRKAEFDILSPSEKTAIGKEMRNAWSPVEITAPVNVSFQANGGFTSNFLGKKVGGIFGINYNKTNRYLKLLNRYNAIDPVTNKVDVISNFDDDKYQQDITIGALGSLSIALNQNNKILVKAIINHNSPNSVTLRNGIDVSRGDDLKGTEFTFKENTFFTSQLTGEHSIAKPLKLKWYGAFNILDGYIPDQRRILYSRPQNTQNAYTVILSNSLSQQSGSRIYQTLSDYIYTAGGDLAYNFKWLNQSQTVKGGYMLQIKDRLYDAQLFANYLPQDNPSIRALPADQVFAAGNFGNGTDNKIAFDAIKGNNFRYMANTILNAGFLQLDNQFSKALRVVWGLRVENYDQLIGSVKKWDNRHSYSKVTDFLPGVNATFKLNNSKSNIRLSGSQTVIRPELRELASLNLYDFELNASVQGEPRLLRTKISNFDLRYELYPRAGEVFTAGIFYKDFDNAIEQYFNGLGGGASSFSFINAKKATSYGIEVELRKKLDFAKVLKNFTFQANASYIKSNVKDATKNLDRSLQGQSPYLINLGLLYDLEKQGFNATLLFNQIGERIYLVGDIQGGAPDIYEAPRPVLDLQLAKKVLKTKAELRLNIADILNQTQYFYQNTNNKVSFQKNTDAYRFTRKNGTNYSITFNYSL